MGQTGGLAFMFVPLAKIAKGDYRGSFLNGFPTPCRKKRGVPLAKLAKGDKENSVARQM